MTPYRIASIVACRIFALHWFVICVFVSYSHAMAIGPLYWIDWKTLGVVILLIVLAVLLWTLAPWIAKHIVQGAECDLEEEPKVSLEAIQTTAFALLGIYFVIKSLPQTIWAIQHYCYMKQIRGANVTLIGPSFITPLAQACLGVWLFVGSRGFVKIFRKLQTAGLPQDD